MLLTLAFGAFIPAAGTRAHRFRAGELVNSTAKGLLEDGSVFLRQRPMIGRPQPPLAP